MRIALIALTLAFPVAALDAAPADRPARAPRAPARPDPGPDSPPKQADRHFKAGVALVKDHNYAAALSEFELAYDIAPHPLVLYNIAGCHRELAHYPEAVSYLERFLTEGVGKVPAQQLRDARAELDALLAMTAQVTVKVSPVTERAQLLIDGTALASAAMPLILTPGEHQLIARAAGRRDAERTLRVAAGDQPTIELTLEEPAATSGGLPPPPLDGGPPGVQAALRPPASSARPWLALGAGFGTDLRRAGHTGAPSLGASVALGSRLGLAVDVVFVAYAVVPSIRVRVAGDALSLHLLGAVPVAFSGDPMTGRFLAVAGGLGLRYRATPWLALRADAYISTATKNQGTAVPSFVSGEVWF